LSNLTEREVRQEKNLQVLRPGEHPPHKQPDKKRNQRIFDLSNLTEREVRQEKNLQVLRLGEPAHLKKPDKKINLQVLRPGEFIQE